MTLLEVRGLTVCHGQLEALRDVNLSVSAGEVVAIIGANGAGKSTLLRTIAGLHTPVAGSVWMDGRDITHLGPEKRVAAGIVLVPEGRRLFDVLNVEENLLAGRYRGRPGAWDMARVLELVPLDAGAAPSASVAVVGWRTASSRSFAGAAGQPTGPVVRRTVARFIPTCAAPDLCRPA